MTLYDKFFIDRGISPEVRDARPYVPWHTGDELRALLAPYLDVLTLSEQRGYARQITAVADQSPEGIIITRGVGEVAWFVLDALRDRPEGIGYFPLTLPELKPFTPVVTDPRQPWTYHGAAPPRWERNAKGKLRMTAQDEHGNWRFLPRSHVHPPALMDAHVEKHHGGENVEHAHQHDAEAAKYLFSQGKGLAAHLDIHPWALARLPKARRVYWSMEGCPKADAILTAILKTGEASSVISSASVTLWDAAELEWFVLRWLLSDGYGGAGDPQVVLVPDDDYHTNEAVIRQALILRTALREMGLSDVVIAAPPPAQGRKGVDEYLAQGGTLGGLRRFEREAPGALLPNGAWKLAASFTPPDGRKPDRRSVERDRKVLYTLSLLGGLNGRYTGTLAGLARRTRLERKATHRAIESLVARGDVTVDRTPVLHVEPMKDRWGNVILNSKTGEPIIPTEWIAPPIITIAPRHRRAIPDSTTTPLGGTAMLHNEPATKADIAMLRDEILPRLNTLLDRGDQAIEAELQDILVEEAGDA